MPSPLDLEPIIARLHTTALGPWTLQTLGIGGGYWIKPVEPGQRPSGHVAAGENPEDGNFIAHSWEDTRNLINEVIRLRNGTRIAWDLLEADATRQARITLGKITRGEHAHPDLEWP